MLRYSLRSLGSRILEQQQRGARQHGGIGAQATAFSSMVRKPNTTVTFMTWPRAQTRRAFHSSSPRPSQPQSQSTTLRPPPPPPPPKNGTTGGAGAGGGAGTGAGTGSGSASGASESLSLSARLKKLSREYGWTAVGVYFGLSLLDFPFCFLLVRTLGTDKIAAAEHYVLNHIQTIIPDSVTDYYHKYKNALKKAKEDSGNAPDGVEAEGWGVKEADERNEKEASLATQLALAYAIHKSFIFVRVPLTAAVTPKVVKVLRSWGWKIGKPKPAA